MKELAERYRQEEAMFNRFQQANSPSNFKQYYPSLIVFLDLSIVQIGHL
jgi:hypothetical protein